MFKYGSFRYFLLKLTLGMILSSISIIMLISLVSYNSADPGFSSYLEGEGVETVSNYLGYIGAYISSFMIVLFGHSSYLLTLFILFTGLRFILGIVNIYIFTKFILLFVSIFFINISLFSLKLDWYEIGILSNITSQFFLNSVQNLNINYFISFIIHFFTTLAGILILFFCFTIRIVHLSKFKFVLRVITVFKMFKYFNLFRYFKREGVNNGFVKKKNEPTIKNGHKTLFDNNQKILKSIKKNKDDDLYRFSLPDISLVDQPQKKSTLNKELERLNNLASQKLEQTLLEYGVEGKIVNFKTGPIVTLFEFIPKAGIKSSKVIGLSDDIARAMSSISARISSQPGKTSLGIEIPNQKREGVLFGDLISDNYFINETDSLTLALGKDISGEKIYADLEKMPHLLIAGTTGSGKSVGINTMILSLLFKFKPNECKFIMIDPKMLELSIYENIPHLLTPVVTNPNKAVFALKWVVREMENRYKLMSSINVKNISSYNDKVLKTISAGRKLFREVQTGIDSETRIPIIEKREINLEKMPFIVVVIDEMADLMMVAGKEVENLVQRIAQMARASGIHLITATQRPSVDVITGTIKANFPSRISYKVASKFDSRTILNEMGAEQLLGSGDMLLLENGGNIKRLHGGYVSEREVEKVVEFIKKQATFDHNKEISLKDEEAIDKQTAFGLTVNNTDELYSKAIDIVIEQQKVSTSYIQRYLQIGYNRAARMIEKMEEEGIISEANNAGKRHVIRKK